MGHSHAIYNHTGKPVQWMNINVSGMKGTYDAFDLADPRVDVQIDQIPVFMSIRFDRQLLRPVPSAPGSKGSDRVPSTARPNGIQPGRGPTWTTFCLLLAPPRFLIYTGRLRSFITS